MHNQVCVHAYAAKTSRIRFEHKIDERTTIMIMPLNGFFLNFRYESVFCSQNNYDVQFHMALNPNYQKFTQRKSTYTISLSLTILKQNRILG